MNTYNVQVNGVIILQKVDEKELNEKLKIIQALVCTSGGKLNDIEVVSNKIEN